MKFLSTMLGFAALTSAAPYASIPANNASVPANNTRETRIATLWDASQFQGSSYNIEVATRCDSLVHTFMNLATSWKVSEGWYCVFYEYVPFPSSP
ncbi:uncharacterized protein BCR38DRAFT_486198 [Pseudomassariella vexata]|uniref:Beta/gamma crystallin 'Greek key' domain-containing protein n=1 Tax=Pseudomassariella vexata TaxID=1141098 RepID=A0A1Y2DW17_9PEZI|nr:uncharacterized protein BCR38DRAFT_486198 [Pseudomassariella vexata]ORY63458.1 hypothetical protein BCR38DRAFT_486198 [Pseudomassariella vexata]